MNETKAVDGFVPDLFQSLYLFTERFSLKDPLISNNKLTYVLLVQSKQERKKKPYHISLYLKCNMLHINMYRANKAAVFYAREMKEDIRELLF